MQFLQYILEGALAFALCEHGLEYVCPAESKKRILPFPLHFCGGVSIL